MLTDKIEQKLKDLDAKIQSGDTQIANNTNILNQLHGYVAGLKEARTTLLAEENKSIEAATPAAAAAPAPVVAEKEASK